MSISKFLTLPRKGAGYCTTLVALAILAAPGLSWAQECNAVVDISTVPSRAGWVDGGAADRYFQLGETVRVSLEVGAGTIGGAPLLVEQFRAALDCQSVDVVSREQCLGYPPFTPSGAEPPNDGDAILYAGNLDVSGTPCVGHTFVLNDLTTPQNLFAFDVTPAVDFAQGERCVIAFDVLLNNYGVAFDEDISRPGVQYLFEAAGFEGACDDDVTGQPSASGRNSTQYQMRSLPLIEIVKQVSVDGGPWLNFAEGTYGTSTAEYRLLVTNPTTFVDPITGVVEGETLVGVILNDITLNLVNVPLPARCEPFAPGDTCTIESGDIGFSNLGGVDVCRTYPDPFINEACTEGTGTPSGILAGPVCDTAEVLCVAEPEIDIIKRVRDPATGLWEDANSAPGVSYPVGAVVRYQLEVCNTGDVDFEDAVVFDPDLLIPPTSIGPLAVGACTFLEEGLGPVTGLDSSIPCAVEQQFMNTAFAEGFWSGGPPVTDNDPANVICAPPELTVVKTGETDTKVGDTITYDVVASNPSTTVALANCVATDTLPGVILPAPFDLAPGASYPYSYDYLVPSGAPNPLPNTARVDCDVVGTASGTIFDDDDWSVPLFTVGATMDKECSDGLGTGNKNLVPGDTIEWDIEVCNTGSADITCTVNDVRAGVTGAILAIPGTTGAPNCDSVIASDSVEAGDAPAILNDATADCIVDDYDNIIAQLDAEDTCPVQISPDISIIKRVRDPATGLWEDANSAPGVSYPVGAVVRYQLEVCNIGDVDLEDVQVFDPTLNIPPTSIGSLPASDPLNPAVSCVTLEEGVGPVSGLNSSIPCSESRQFENIAYADGFYLGGQGPVTDNDPANVICVPPELTVVKTGETDTKVGDTITYDVVASNPSTTVALANCVATDTLPGVILPAPFDLAPGASYPYSYDYLVPSGAPNPLPNTARVDCDVVGTASGTIFDDDDWSVPLFTVGATMDKECSDGLGTGNKNLVPGDTIEWDIEVCNTGSADITCTVNDVRAGVTGAILAIPGTTGAPNCDSVIASDSVEAGDAPAILNDATADCIVDDYDNIIAQLDAEDTCPVQISPDISIIKRVRDPATGLWEDANSAPGVSYPVGAVVRYQLEVCNIGDVDLEDVQVFDPTLNIPPTSIGSLPASDPLNPAVSCVTLEEGVGPVSGLDSSIPCSESRQFENIAYADGFYLGGQGPVTDNDPANVICVPPELTVVKTGETDTKVGDTITYDVVASNPSTTVALANCVATDTLPGVILPAPFDLAPGASYPYSYDYLVPSGAPNPLPNTARVDCDVVGTASGTIFDDDDWSVPLFTVGATMDKECSDGLGTGNKDLVPGDTIEWDIEVCNTGSADITCTVNDVRAGVTGAILAIPGTTGAPNCDSVIASDSVEAGDAPAILNDATADCEVDSYDNTIERLTAEDACPVQVGDEICRTPGFWKSHAGVEKEGRSTNLTQEVIAYNGGSLGFICGDEITNTSVNGYDGAGSYPGNGDGSAVEGMCVHPKQESVRQLQRQLIAAALNCVVSDGGADCTGISIEQDWKAANIDCAANDPGLTSWIGIIDDFNNGVDSDCHDRNLKESDVFDDVDYKVPGPAGSSRACNAATKNDFYLVP